MYDIYMGSQVVGQAEVIKEGLYYRFSCKCTPPSEGIHRILVSDGNNTRDLGICAPTGEWFCLVTRVPVKYLPGEKLEFSLVLKEKQLRVVPLETNKPFPELDKLESAHLEEIDGKTEIVIDPTQDLQDSGLNQGSLQK